MPHAAQSAEPCTTGPVQLFNGSHGFPSVPGDVGGSGIHSFSVSNDGKRMYNALLSRGFGVSDVSDFTDTNPATNSYRVVTPSANRVQWGGPGAHSAVKLWNKDWVYVSDEVYGTSDSAGHGCPWGWARFVDIADPTRPAVREDFRLPENDPAICTVLNPLTPRTSYSAHNPTLTQNIAFSTWHSGGFQAMDISDPANVTQLAEYKPDAAAGRHQPRIRACRPTARSTGREDVKVVMWSYPVIQDGLIYVVDLRNGLYILKYNGPHEDEVNQTGFLEGNSNQGDAMCIEPVPGATNVYCDIAARGRRGRHRAGDAVAVDRRDRRRSAPSRRASARRLDASTNANVISTAGDATLSVADPSAQNTGHLVNGTFFLP